MDITLGDVVGTQLNKNPDFYFRLSKQEKIIQFNMLAADGKYFDVKEKKVKLIPTDRYVRLDKNNDLEIGPLITMAGPEEDKQMHHQRFPHQPFPVGAELILRTENGEKTLRVTKVIPVVDFEDIVRYSYDFEGDKEENKCKSR